MDMKPILLDTFKGRLRLEGILTTRTGLHIGAGGSGDPLATDSPVVRNAAGAPFIPGASLKGVVRSAAESLLRDTTPRADAGVELRTCDFLAGQPCIHHKDVEAIREKRLKPIRERSWKSLTERNEAESRANREVVVEIWKESCTVCRLFGSLAMASRARFPDLPLYGGLPRLEIRNGVGIDRDRELAASGVLYDFEAVPPGTAFDLIVILDNPHEAEVGLVLWLFDQLHQGNLSLGGKTSRGLGQVEVRWRHIHETRVDGGNPFADLLSTQDLLDPGHDLLEADEEPTETSEGPELPTSGDADAWKALAEILREMSPIDKTALGQKARDVLGIGDKEELNQRLALGLEGRRARKVWDQVMQRFVDCGFLVEKGAGWILAADQPPERPPETTEQEEKSPHLQQVQDRYVGAMARLWQEAF